MAAINAKHPRAAKEASKKATHDLLCPESSKKKSRAMIQWHSFCRWLIVKMHEVCLPVIIASWVSSVGVKNAAQDLLEGIWEKVRDENDHTKFHGAAADYVLPLLEMIGVDDPQDFWDEWTQGMVDLTAAHAAAEKRDQARPNGRVKAKKKNGKGVAKKPRYCQLSDSSDEEDDDPVPIVTPKRAYKTTGLEDEDQSQGLTKKPRLSK